MKTLILLRHGKASQHTSQEKDHDRTLKKRGQRNAAEMGEKLRKEGLMPQRIFSSTAERAKQTAELARSGGDLKPEIEYFRELYHAAPETYLEVASEHAGDEDKILLVGHNPGMEDLVSHLSGERIAMPTAGMAVMECELKDWTGLSQLKRARLKHFWIPEDDED